MQLHLEVVSTGLGQSERAGEARVIGEILPFVLAKYGIDLQPTPRTEVAKIVDDYSSRFQGV